MKLKTLALGASVLAAVLNSNVSTAAPPVLFDIAFNIDGDFHPLLTPFPSSVNDTAFDYSTGLGSLTVSLGDPGFHYVGLFVDHEIDESTNTFYNEFGAVSGAPASGEEWEIDEPGWVFGDIYDNALNGALDNSNAVPSSAPDDVSMALARAFLLGPGQSGEVTFTVSETAPASGFYLRHVDPDSNASIYFSSSLSVTRGVPDSGATLPTLAMGCLGLAVAARRFRCARG